MTTLGAAAIEGNPLKTKSAKQGVLPTAARPDILPQGHWIAATVAVGVLLSHSQQFFPNASGLVGHDYALFFPYLLAGRYWAAANGYWTIPDYIPSFCGGIPWLANPQSMYFSLPQWLSFPFEPVGAVWATYLTMACIGGIGTYSLLRMGFRTSRPAATLAAILFGLNGFLFSRMVVGHLTFHGIALVPAIALACIFRPHHGPMIQGALQIGAVGALVGIGMAYIVYSGLPYFLLQIGLMLLTVILAHQVRFGPCWTPWQILTIGAILCLVIVAPKLFPALQLLAQFPQGGAETLALMPLSWQSLRILIAGFLMPGSLPTYPELVNQTYRFGRHEFDYGLTLVPVLAVAMASLSVIRRPLHPLRRPSVASLWLVLLLLLPLPLTFGTEAWSGILKSLPYFGGSALNVRWWSLWLLPLLLLTALAFDAIPVRASLRPLLALGLALAAMVQVFVTDNDYYRATLAYDPTPIRQAFRALNETGHPVPITLTGNAPITVAGTGRMLGPNDGLVLGYSSYRCYETLFGYDLRNFPATPPEGTSPAIDYEQQRIALTDPACYVYGPEFGCSPGDRFAFSDVLEAERFSQYRPMLNRGSSTVSPLSWMAVIGAGTAGILIILSILQWAIKMPWRRKPGKPPTVRSNNDDE